MNNKKNIKLYIMINQAIIACLYVTLSFLSIPLAFGSFQIRLSEGLCVLPIFSSSNIFGISLGCFLTNFLLYGNIIDMIFGTIATVIGGIGTYYFRKNYILSCAIPIISNTIIIPLVLKYAYGFGELYIIMVIQMFISEFLSIGLIGRVVIYVQSRFQK
ncbi:MAG: QueT transporter family protein [Eubacteriales bacterium]|nr:QueT transporter family protein [Eubacteriales bacterium]